MLQIPDIIAPDYTAATMSVFAGKGDGTFFPSKPYATDVSPGYASVGDFNADGQVDIAIAQTGTGNGNINVFLNAGAGNFGSYTRYAVGAYPYALLSGDFNKDGNIDLFTASVSTHSSSILFGTGSGSFSPAVVVDSSSGSVYNSAIADMNADGNLDVLTVDKTNNVFHLLRGKSDGSFLPALAYPANLSGLQTIAAGDFNNDGKADVVLGTSGGGTNLSIALNRGCL